MSKVLSAMQEDRFRTWARDSYELHGGVINPLWNHIVKVEFGKIKARLEADQETGGK